MKLGTFVSLLAVVALGQGCSKSAKPDLDKICVSGSKKEVLSKTAVDECTLAADTQIGPYSCKKGTYVYAYKTGELKECWVTQPVSVGDVKCDGSVILSDKGKLLRCQLAEAKKLSGIDVPAKTWVTVYPSGALKRIEGTHTIKGLPCKGYGNYLWENGNAARCELAETRTIEGKKFDAGQTACFDEGGKLADCSKVSFSSVE